MFWSTYVPRCHYIQVRAHDPSVNPFADQSLNSYRTMSNSYAYFGDPEGFGIMQVACKLHSNCFKLHQNISKLIKRAGVEAGAEPLQYTTSDWTLADTEYDRVRRALDEDRPKCLERHQSPGRLTMPLAFEVRLSKRGHVN